MRYNRIVNEAPRSLTILWKKVEEMDYLAWSEEYTATAQQLAKVIARLKKQRSALPRSERKELDNRVLQYKIYYGECIRTADLLRERGKGIA